MAGFPNASNTGVPAGTSLAPSGSVTISTAGAVLDAKLITGCIQVRANNVTIKRTRVLVTAECAHGMAIDTGDHNEYTGTLIEDTEIDGRNLGSDGAAIGYAGFTALRVNIHNLGDGLRLGRGGTGLSNMTAVVQDSYIHDEYGDSGSHNAGSGGFSTVWARFTHDNIECFDTNGSHCTDAIGWLNDGSGPTAHVTVENSRLAGGGYTAYSGMACDPAYTNIVWQNNTFAGSAPKGLADYGPVAQAECPNNPGNIWSGNKFESGQTITP
jgi:hypothetical protein